MQKKLEKGMGQNHNELELDFDNQCAMRMVK